MKDNILEDPTRAHTHVANLPGATRGLSIHDRSIVIAHVIRALAFARDGRADLARHEMDAVFQVDADLDEVCLIAAERCVTSGAPALALTWIDRAIEHGAISMEVLRTRGRIIADLSLLSGMHQHLELVVRLHPNSVEARDQLIRSCLQLHLYDLAREHLGFAISLRPTCVALHLDAATACLGQGATRAAVDALERALELNAVMAERLRIVWLLLKAGALDQALRTSERNCALEPDNPQVQLQASFLALWRGDAQAATRTSVALSGHTPGVTRLRAAIAFVDCQYDTALALATDAVTQNPNDAEAHALRGAALLRLGRHSEAQTSARTALRSETEWLHAARLVEFATGSWRTGLGPLFERVELDELSPLWLRTDGVSPLSTAFWKSRPKNVATTIDLGLQRLSGNFSSALTYVHETSHVWSSFTPKVPVRVACMRKFDLIKARPLPWVVEQIHALGAAYPDSPYAHTHAAELWLWFGDYEACERECRKALTLPETNGTRWAWVGLGASLMFQGRYTDALKVFNRSEKLMKPGAPLFAYRGETFRRSGHLEKARVDLERTLELGPTRVSAWLNLGILACAQGRHAEARDIDARLRANMPRLIHDVESNLRRRSEEKAWYPDTLTATFAHALRVMLGNRSSNRITYRLDDDLVRVMSTRSI